MKFIVASVLIFAASFCFARTNKSNPRQEAMEVIDQYIKTLQKEEIVNIWHGVRCAGPDKIYDGKIHEISLGFSIDKNLKMDEAKKFFYRVVDGLLEKINSNDKIKDHFYHYPVTYKDLHFSIGFDCEEKRHLKKDDVRQVVIQDNEIGFLISNYDGASNKLVAHETYPGMGTLSIDNEDAFRWVMENLPETEDSTDSIK